MIPVLVEPPVSVPVSADDLKAHVRVSGADDDALIDALAAGVVGYLDGWRGVLGRAIMQQTWRIVVDGAGELILPMPDVSAAVVNYGGDDVALDVGASAGGPTVTVTGAGYVDFTCAMPAAQLDVARVLIKILVGHWYENREAVVTGITAAALPFAADSLISSLRWGAGA